jgi:hypothetical protein
MLQAVATDELYSRRVHKLHGQELKGPGSGPGKRNCLASSPETALQSCSGGNRKAGDSLEHAIAMHGHQTLCCRLLQEGLSKQAMAQRMRSPCMNTSLMMQLLRQRFRRTSAGPEHATALRGHQTLPAGCSGKCSGEQTVPKN